MLLNSAHRPLRHLLASHPVRNASHDALSLVVPPLNPLSKKSKPHPPFPKSRDDDELSRVLREHRAKKLKKGAQRKHWLSPEAQGLIADVRPPLRKPKALPKKQKKRKVKEHAGSFTAVAAPETSGISLNSGFVKEEWAKPTLKDYLTPEAGGSKPKLKAKSVSPPRKDKPHPPHVLAPKCEVQGTLGLRDEAVLEDVLLPHERPPIAKLSHGLERVLFNPGVHWLQDPRSRVYNFTPWLQTVPKVSEFDFDRIPRFVPSSRDTDLRTLAERENKPFAGSTSSLSGILSHCYFLVSEHKEVDTSILSHDFRNMSTKFAPAQRWPAMITLNHKDGVYTIDAEKSPFDMPEKTILTWIGTMLEKFLTMPQRDFSQLLKASPLVTDRRDEREAYRYAKSESFVFRSQLDCYDPRLPGTGVFDIKTRACAPIRLDVLNYEEHTGYTIKKLYGELESFEKEYYDLIRSAFLKYSFQVRIGNMDGVILAYHNTETLFGFQYIPLSEMDERLFGPGEGVGDKVFEKCVGLMERVVSEVANCFPGKSSRATFYTKEDTAAMYVWVEPLEWSGDPDRKPIEQLRVEVKSYIGEDPVPGYRAVQNAADPGTPWTMEYKIQRLDVKPDAARKKLTAVQEKILKTFLIPSGIDPENLEEYWRTLGYGGKTEGAESGAPAFDPSLFTAPPQFIQKLRELSRKGKEEKTQMLEKYKDAPSDGTKTQDFTQVSPIRFLPPPAIIATAMSNDDAGKEKRKSWMPKLPRPGSSGGRSPSSPRPGSSSSSSGLSFSFSKLNNGSGSRSSASLPTGLATPVEGQELDVAVQRPPIASQQSSDSVKPSPASSKPSSISRNQSFESPPVSAPATPRRRSSTNLLLTAVSPQELKNHLNDLERTQSGSAKPESSSRHSTSLGKSISSMMSGLSLSRTNTRDSTDDRGRSMFSGKRWSSSSQAPPDRQDGSRSRSRARSQSPFVLKRWRTRESSPPIGRVALNQSDAELSEAESTIHARSAFTDDPEDGQDGDMSDEVSEESLSDEDIFDPITERNTEQNALIAPVATEHAMPEVEDPDPVGEGVNVIVPPEPYFPSSLNTLDGTSRSKRNPRRRKSVRTHEPLPLKTSRPVFQRDRCTITITQGDPDAMLDELNRKRRRYVVASDLSEESRYAVEWGIGTVLRDGDEMLLVSVVENEARLDPRIPDKVDRQAKLRSQQERQGMAYILARQVTSLLQRTRLNVTVACQAWHAKNARHILLDIVDYTEPTMLIVGSRGLSHLNGILLGSTSHYLIEKCSVPVMVARRRLKRPPRKAAHLSTSRTRIKLAEAGIDRVAGKVDEDVHAMRDELQKEDQRRTGGPGSRDGLRNYTSSGGDVHEEDEAEQADAENDDEEPQITIHGP